MPADEIQFLYCAGEATLPITANGGDAVLIAAPLRERRASIQKMVAAFAEAVRFVEENREKAKASVSKVLRLKDEMALQASYDAYAKRLMNRRVIVRVNAVTEGVEIVRESGTKITKKATYLIDNSFAENLEKSGFLKELWGGKIS